MLRKILWALAVCLFTSNSFSQVELDSLSNLDLCATHNQMLNDIWGYTDEFGNEYALVGGTKGTSVVDISDPSNPIEIFYEPGMESTWRDLKTVGDYAYVTTEAQNGLLIIDLSPLPGSTTLPTTYYYGPLGSEWYSAHNLYADDNGQVYIFGANRGSGGVIILDVTSDPMNPFEVGTFDNWYVHDGYVNNDTMYLGHISDGFFSIVDVVDPANPVLLGTHDSPSTFTHNIWTMGDQYAFTTDEVSNGFIGAYDISDPANIVEVDRIRSSPGQGIIPHNTHVLGNYLLTSYYSDGVVVHDATHPYNLIEVANYRTYPVQTTGYDGCWGVYPFFSSGVVVASDRSYGLFVLGSNYQQAAYLEGTITNSVTSAPVDAVLVEIVGNNQLDHSNTAGFYASGMASAGTYDVNYTKIGYYPQTISVSIANGVITNQDVQMVPIPPFSLTVNVVDAVTNAPISNADIRLEAILVDHEGLTNALGEENFTMYYEENYRVFVGKWGYVTHCDHIDLDAQTGSITIALSSGYYDDFTFDNNWSTLGTAATGQFERAIPLGSPTSPYVDSDSDCSDYCFITENLSSGVDSDGDVDDGSAVLQSPIFDLTSSIDPYLHYERWFYSDQGILPPGDSLEVFLSNGVVLKRIDVQTYDPTTWGQWISKDIRILDYVSPTANMMLTYRTSDYGATYNVTEAAFDHFYVVEAEFVALSEQSTDAWMVAPNPSQGRFELLNVTNDLAFEVRSCNGQLVAKGTYSAGQSIDGSAWENGIYFIRIENQMQKIVIAK